MLRVFALKNSVFEDGKNFDGYLALTDGERREQVKSLVGARAKNASLSAGVILPLALAECGLGGEVRIERGKWGKPRLVSPQGVFFNLSHSGEYTVIAISDGEVGCDIQQIKPVNSKLAERYFHPEEVRAICVGESCGECGNGNACEDRQELFFRYWCAKESFIKATGEGLSRPLNSFFIRLPQSEVFEAVGALTPWRVVESGEIEGYRIAVCTQTPRPFTVEWLHI